jgi:hypothetical protein
MPLLLVILARRHCKQLLEVATLTLWRYCSPRTPTSMLLLLRWVVERHCRRLLMKAAGCEC